MDRVESNLEGKARHSILDDDDDDDDDRYDE
jgi:hypothetical protein